LVWFDLDFALGICFDFGESSRTIYGLDDNERGGSKIDDSEHAGSKQTRTRRHES
jgi:hypothetical protein